MWNYVYLWDGFVFQIHNSFTGIGVSITKFLILLNIPPIVSFCFKSVSAFLHFHNDLLGSVQMKAPESTVTLREGMILDCLCPWTGQLTMVSWTKKSLSQPVAIYHPQYGTNFESSYDGRVEFVKTTQMDGSISISNVTEDDIGQYHCSLQTYPQGSWTKDTFVEKKGDWNHFTFAIFSIATPDKDTWAN